MIDLLIIFQTAIGVITASWVISNIIKANKAEAHTLENYRLYKNSRIDSQ